MNLDAARTRSSAGGRYEEYHPYGSTAWWAGASGLVPQKQYRFTGMKRDDETGLQCHGVRYYAVWLGRWVSADSIGLGDGVNRYQYGRSSPLGYRDREGTAPEQLETPEFLRLPDPTEAPSLVPSLQDSAVQKAHNFEREPEPIADAMADIPTVASVRAAVGSADRLVRTVYGNRLPTGRAADRVAVVVSPEVGAVESMALSHLQRQIAAEQREPLSGRVPTSEDVAFLAKLQVPRYVEAWSAGAVGFTFEGDPRKEGDEAILVHSIDQALIVHELVHYYTSAKFLQNFTGRQLAVVEGVTEYLTLSAIHPSATRLSDRSGGYKEQVAWVEGMLKAGAVSEKELEAALFEGNALAIEKIAAYAQQTPVPPTPLDQR